MTGNRESSCCVLRWHTCLLFVSLSLLCLHLFILTGSSPLHPISNVSRVSADACDVILHPSVLSCAPILYLSSSISRLDSLSDSCLHRASLRSISLWSFLCSRMFSSLMCRSSSMYWARFSVSGREKQKEWHQTRHCQAGLQLTLCLIYHQKNNERWLS